MEYAATSHRVQTVLPIVLLRGYAAIGTKPLLLCMSGPSRNLVRNYAAIGLFLCTNRVCLKVYYGNTLRRARAPITEYERSFPQISMELRCNRPSTVYRKDGSPTLRLLRLYTVYDFVWSAVHATCSCSDVCMHKTRCALLVCWAYMYNCSDIVFEPKTEKAAPHHVLYISVTQPM